MILPSLSLHADDLGRLVLVAGDWSATFPTVVSATVEVEHLPPPPERRCSIRGCVDPVVARSETDEGQTLMLCTRHGLEWWEAVNGEPAEATS